ncbi:MAG: type II toxin-antitoxin system prevent-host-death family antitoxin [Anaerolineae bacterium]|nr:type II toxin-antitoxin system prevent-host-death family antitoxin [Anaerolineae bacterium]
MLNQSTITASDLQRASGSVLKRVALGGEHLVIERAGYPIAVILSYQEYEALMRERALAGHRDLVVALSRDAERQGLTEEQLMAELDEIKHQVFEETYGRRSD